MAAMNIETSELTRYHDAIQYLDGLNRTMTSPDYMRDQSQPSVFLERTRSLLDALGNPEKGFKYIHITGTSGKGTVATMTHEALVASGKRVGLFTSPYVVAATEKIRVNDLYIAPDEFASILEEIKPHIEHARGTHGRPTYFEVFFAIALVYFQRQQCEWVVLEVGAGGRYDATNVIESPLVTAITNIDYDHVQILGNTLTSIAENKAGIIKKDSAFFTTEKRLALLKLFEKECVEKGATFTPLAVVSDYQENNKTLVRAICRHIGLAESDIRVGEEARLPGRFETMQEQPRVVLDGAHNRAKMKSCASNVKKLSFKKLHLIFALKDDKNIASGAREILPLADTATFTVFQNTTVHCVLPQVLKDATTALVQKSARVQIITDAKAALTDVLKYAAKDDLVLVTGSFYLVGELRRVWYSEEWVVENRRSFK